MSPALTGAVGRGGWQSTVEWRGLTKMIYNVKTRVPRELSTQVSDLTKDWLEKVYQRAYRNLSGTMVNVITGHLRASLKKVQVNQWAGRVYDDAFYASFVHDGTSHMAPRPYIQRAVDDVGGQLPGMMGKTMSTVLKHGMS